MRPTRITYDPDGDVLYVNFGQPTASTGYQLSDQILLRVDPKTQMASGLTIFNYAVHATAAREIPLPGIEEQGDARALLLNILGSAPVNQFLTIIARDGGLFAHLLSPSLQQAVAG
jgi:uncharacterized protein YuzE